MKHSILKLSALTVFVLLILSMSATSLHAQLPKRAKILQTPLAYLKPVGNNSTGTLPKSNVAGGTNDWVVSSNKSDNIVYDKPDGNNIATVDFMENFYAIGETDDYLQLIEYDPTVTSTGASRRVDKKKAKYVGWIPKKNLLLWRRSLVNKKTEFSIKGLVVHSELLLNRGIGGEKQLVLHNSPTLEKTTQNENDIRLFEFLYVFDKKDDNYLVGVSQEIPRSRVATKKVVKGWMSGKNIRLWSQRLCIEPNSDPKAAAERRSKGVKVTLFNSHAAAKGLKTGQQPQYSKILWDDDQYEKGYPPAQKRMPVVSSEEDGIYKTGVITDVYNKRDNVILSTEEHARLSAEYNAIRDKKQNINMVFIVDGTKGNHPSFSSIIQAIYDSSNLLENTSKNYKIGTYIYGKSGEGVIDRHPLTTNHTAVIQVLKNYQNKQDLSEDNDDPTDMYEAIKTALRPLTPEETNILVLIGDAGNALNGNSIEVIQKMKEKECGIISFQTRNVGGKAGLIYDKFVDQTKKFIEESSRRTTFRPKFYIINEANTTYRLRYPVEATLPGSLTFCDKGKSISPNELQEEIRQMLKSFEDQHERLLRDLDCKIYVDCKPGINEAILEYMLKEIPDFDPRVIRDMDYQLFVEAYAPMQVNKLEHPLFKHVLFLDDRELYELETTLKKLVVGGSSSELRENIINAYKEIITSHYGSDVTTISNMTLGEAMEAVVGLPSTSDLLNDHTLKDLEKIKDDEIRDIIDYIEDKLLAMKKVVGNPDYFFRSRDNTYYWVPQDVIP